MRFGLGLFFASLMVTLAVGEGPKRHSLIAACLDQKASCTATETVNLTITIGNRGTTTFYVYRSLEWGWSGLWFGLLDATGNRVRPKQPVIAPLPPPPLADKSELAGWNPAISTGNTLISR